MRKELNFDCWVYPVSQGTPHADQSINVHAFIVEQILLLLWEYVKEGDGWLYVGWPAIRCCSKARCRWPPQVPTVYGVILTVVLELACSCHS